MLKTIPFDIIWKIQEEFTINEINVNENTLTIKTKERGIGPRVKEYLENPMIRINSDASWNEWKMGGLIPIYFGDTEIKFKGRIWKSR